MYELYGGTCYYPFVASAPTEAELREIAKSLPVCWQILQDQGGILKEKISYSCQGRTYDDAKFVPWQSA
jgi:hypothetical protein